MAWFVLTFIMSFAVLIPSRGSPAPLQTPFVYPLPSEDKIVLSQFSEVKCTLWGTWLEE